MKNISPTENLDILLALSVVFENAVDSSNTKTLSELVEKSFGAMPSSEFSAIQTRAFFLDELPVEKRELWREICLERILRKTVRLDENINPVHIANVLSREPKSIQKHILRKLPPDLNERISEYLGVKFDSQPEKTERIHQEIAELIRQEFLAHFLSLEDIYEPLEIDRLSVGELAKFIHHLGLREVAVASRGINSKETLAAFLNSFAPEDTREIVQYLTELENIKPFWVAQADELVRDNWETESNTQQVLEKIGIKLLAVAFFTRDETAKDYTRQKLSRKESLNWKRILRQTEKESSANDQTKQRFDKRRKMVNKLAVKFVQTGRL